MIKKNLILFCLFFNLSIFAQEVELKDNYQSNIVSKKVDSLFKNINKDPNNIENYIEVSYLDEFYLNDNEDVNFDSPNYFIKEFIFRKIDSLKEYNPKNPIPYLINHLLPNYKIDRVSELRMAYEIDSTYSLTNKLFYKLYIEKFKENEINKDSVLLYKPIIEKHLKYIDFDNVDFNDLVEYYSWFYYFQNQEKVKLISQKLIDVFGNFNFNFYLFPNDLDFENFYKNHLSTFSFSFNEGFQNKDYQYLKNFKLVNKFFVENFDNLKRININKELFGLSIVKEPNIVFYWERSFHNPIMFQIIKKKNNAKILIFEGEKDEFGEIDYKKQKPIKKIISLEKWEYLKGKIDSIENKYIIPNNYGFDGSYWSLEYYDKEMKLLFSLWSPKTECNSNDDFCKFVHICLEIMNESGLKIIRKSEVNSDDFLKEKYFLY